MTTIPHARVLASAGTGKTHRLTSRYLHLVLTGADPRTLLATTFTRAAAAEIRQRVLVRVAEALLDDSRRVALMEDLGLDALSHADLTAVLDRLLLHLSELQICTIDSFISRLTTVGSRELGLGNAPELIRNDRDRGIQGKVLRKLFDRLDSESEIDAFARSIDGLSKGRPPQSITQTIQKIVDFGLPLFHQSQGVSEIWRWPNDPRVDELDLGSLASSLAEASGGRSKKISEDLQRLSAVLESLVPGEDRFHILKDALSKGLSPKIRAGADTFGTGKNNLIDGRVRQLIERLNDYSDQLVVREYGRRTFATYDLLLRYHLARETVRREEGVASFGDLVRVLVEADPDLIRDELWFRLDAQIDHLLLDEFQDTSLMQWKVLRPLAEEIVSDGTGERTFFCVGDVKQSIYSWRGGLPDILEYLPQLILEQGARAGLEEEVLSRSWRTGPEILSVINHVFASIDQCTILTQPEPSLHAARRFQNLWEQHRSAPSMPSGCFELIASSPDGESGTAPALRDAAARTAADLAAELHGQYPDLSIGVLTPKNSVAAQVVGHLRRQGLDATGEGGGSFLDCGATIVFLDAMRLAIHPGDSAAFFNVCTSPLAGLLDCDLSKVASEDLARALRRSFAGAGISRTFEDWFGKLADQLDRREMARLERLIIETHRLEAGGQTDLLQVREELESLRLDEPGSDSIRVMTIHGSKGLAFDLVILAGVDGQLTQTVDLVHERDPRSLELSRVSRWVEKGLLPPSIEPLQSATQSDQVFERICQLYVAMTRARRGLFVVVAPPGMTGVPKVSMARIICDSILPTHAVDLPQRPKLLAAVGDRSSLPRSIQPQPSDDRLPDFHLKVVGRQRETFASPPSARTGQATVSSTRPDDSNETAEDARLFGLAMHALLALVEFIEEPLPGEPILRRALRRVSPDCSDEWQDRMLGAFHEILAQSEVRRILSRVETFSCHPDATNLRILREAHWLRVTPSGELQQGVIDRALVFEQSGEPVGALVIDWKTDQIPAEGTDEKTLAHQDQLIAYRDALVEMERVSAESVEICVIYLRSGIRTGLKG